MDSVVNKAIVLQLNRSWQPIGFRTVKQAIIAMCGGDGTPPALAMDIEIDSDGNLSNAVPIKWDEWTKLPVRESDLSIATRNGKIRVPTVIICPNFSKMPTRKPRLTKGAIYARDRGVCQYSGRRLSRSEATLDHILPRSRGGRDSFGNLVLCHREINSMKGNKLNEEAGLKLMREPKEPMPMPISATIREARHPHWEPFLHR